MNKDVERFIELMKTDEGLREKMTAAGKNYTGEKTQEAVFMNVIQPAAEEAGCVFTEEEYLSYASGVVQSLDLNEMDQVNGRPSCDFEGM